VSFRQIHLHSYNSVVVVDRTVFARRLPVRFAEMSLHICPHEIRRGVLFLIWAFGAVCL
jgi:hypothetical protein